MEKLFLVMALIIGILSFSALAEARTIRVKGYYKSSTGSYMMPYYRTSPSSYKLDNWSTKGNYNPYTGRKGSVNPFKW